MVLSQPFLTIYRESLLAINSKHRYVLLDKENRDVITRLQLRRRGHRAGEHHRRRVNAAQAVASSINCAVTAGEIPTIIGSRAHNVNNDQLFASRLERRPTVLETAPRHLTAPSSLIQIKIPRRAGPRTNFVRFATWNIPSVNNKVDGVYDVMSQSHLDAIALTETWHEDS